MLWFFWPLLHHVPSDISCSSHVSISVFTRFWLAVFAAAAWTFLLVKVWWCIGASRPRIEQKHRSWWRSSSRKDSCELSAVIASLCAYASPSGAAHFNENVERKNPLGTLALLSVVWGTRKIPRVSQPTRKHRICTRHKRGRSHVGAPMSRITELAEPWSLVLYLF